MINEAHLDLLRRMAVQAQHANMDVALGANVVLALVEAATTPNGFFLFGWEDYEARGGAKDLIGVFGSLEEAKRAERRCERSHIATFDGVKFSILLEWESRVDFPDGDLSKPRETTGWRAPY